VDGDAEVNSPPTTRTRPLLSGVAVRLARAVDMLEVAVQLLLAAKAGEATTKRAPTTEATNIVCDDKRRRLVRSIWTT
jgi:hypothetical protein